jgi:hypothetical protein
MLALVLAACSRGSPAPAPRATLGNVMAEVGRRFEIAGRAARANRFELAEYEAGELQEMFASDVPGAAMPKEGPTAHIPAMARAFVESNAPELRKAAASKDRAAFAAAFQRAADACNGCHVASAKGFIQVSSEPGRGVPDLGTLPLPPPPPPAAPATR